MERKYYAKDLVTFVKYKEDWSNSYQYMFVGFLNNEGTRFKDVLTGNIYNVNKYTRRSGGRDGLAMEIDGQDFIWSTIKIDRNLKHTRFKVLKFSDDCIFERYGRCDLPFLDEQDGNEQYHNLYNLVEKLSYRPQNLVTTSEIYYAVKDANEYAEMLVRTGHVKRPSPAYDVVDLTKEERDF